MTAWDVSTATYASKSKSVTTQESAPTGLFFKPDGLSMYAVGLTNDTVYQYTLSTAWDVSTASYASKSKSVAAQQTEPLGLFFKPDGLTMYVVGTIGDIIHQYTLSSAWDVSTASYASLSKAVGTEDTTPHSVFFKPDDGLKMYVMGLATDSVYQYTLSSAWDVSTASYASLSKSVTAEEGTPRGLFFKPDGLSMWIVGGSNDTVYQYTLGTAWDVSTASYASLSKSVNAQATTPTAVFFKPDGLSMYVMDNPSDTVYQYTLPAAAGGALTVGWMSLN